MRTHIGRQWKFQFNSDFSGEVIGERLDGSGTFVIDDGMELVALVARNYVIDRRISALERMDVDELLGLAAEADDGP